MARASYMVWIGSLLLSFHTSTQAEEPPRVLFAEKFSGKLDAGWSWLREEPMGWRLADGTLQIRAVPGHLFQQYNDARNVLLRAAPETSQPWAAEVFVQSRPKQQFEEAQLLLYWDDDHHVGLFQEQLGKPHVRMISEKAGKAGFHFERAYEPESLWLRLVVDDGKATGYFRRPDQNEWQKMATVDLPAAGPPRVGIYAGGGVKETDRWATFRDFRILEFAE